jgi:cytoskeleton-associated protein 5
VQTLAANVSNVNIKVMTGAANCISKLATGLRGGFLAKYRGEVMRPLFSRLKEVGEKAKPVFGALQAVFETSTLSDCLETTLEFLKDKNPRIKQGTSDFLVNCLERTKTVPSKAEQKEIAEAGGKLLPESAPATREGGAKILGTLMKIVGERATYAYLTGVDKLDKYKPKIAEYHETAKVVAKERPKPIVAPPKPAAPAGKKVVGKKPALGMKKPAPPAAASPAPESPAKPAPRALPSKLGGVPKPGGLPTPGAGLKLQRKLAGPGSAASPSRRLAEPPSEDTAPPPAAPKFGLGRGLAGRPIAKPSAPAESAPSPISPPANVMSAAVQAELDELRKEKENFSRTIEDMKSERSRLNSNITELQNQNAQLIEDHTRDVLGIKAKETQLVRARSDAEAAEANVQKQQREIERLKRELARALRASAMSPPNATSDTGSIGAPETSSIYQEPTGSAHAFARNGLHAGSRFESTRPRSIVSASPSEEKENTGLESPGFGSRESGLGRRKLSPTYGYSGIGSPTRSSARNSNANLTEDDPQQPRSTEPAENWKRAAEVTSQLKARIEQMKVSKYSPCLMCTTGI